MRREWERERGSRLKLSCVVRDLSCLLRSDEENDVLIDSPVAYVYLRNPHSRVEHGGINVGLGLDTTVVRKSTWSASTKMAGVEYKSLIFQT